MNAIETENLTKVFAELTAVDGLNLTVAEGSIYGFLGPNGAGKTTTLRMLVGLAKPTSGDAVIMGSRISNPNRAYLRKISYLPDVPGFYEWMRASEFLRFVGETFGLGGSALRAKIGEVLEITGLKGVKKRIGGYSRGMRQRLGMAQALINEPAIIFMDEPTSALDPIGRKEVLEAIAGLAGRTTVFFSTHILNDVERVCDTVAILNKGKLATEQRIDCLRASYATRYIYLEFEDGADPAALTEKEPWLGKPEPYQEGWRLHPSDLRRAQRVLPGLIAERSLCIRRFDLLEPSLEDIFIRLVNEP